MRLSFEKAQCLQHILEFTDHLEIDARIKMHNVLSNSSSGSIKLSIEPFMEEIKPVAEKYEFENPVIKINIKSKNIRILRILMPSWKPRNSKEILPYKCNVSDWDTNGSKQTRVTEENEFESRGRTIKAFLGNFRLSGL